MKSIISPNGTFGGFSQVTTLADAYEADGTIYPFNVIGSPNSIGIWVEPPLPLPVPPEIVTPRQIRMAMSRTVYQATTLRVAVEQIVAIGTQDLKDWYEQSTEFFRHQSNVIDMGLALGVSSTELDTLWILASTL
jgi:hypothetical protein